DLFVEWPLDEGQGLYGPVQRVVVELKLLRGTLDAVLAQGLPQTADYARRAGADEAHLVVFDRDFEKPWDEKVWRRAERCDGWDITVWGA
ncbi:MAG: ATP-binding protein, partial [Acidobacteriota bacterium]|nr:ATP-binding protein [Acidobacteriota bacterium]